MLSTCSAKALCFGTCVWVSLLHELVTLVLRFLKIFILIVSCCFFSLTSLQLCYGFKFLPLLSALPSACVYVLGAVLAR